MVDFDAEFSKFQNELAELGAEPDIEEGDDNSNYEAEQKAKEEFEREVARRATVAVAKPMLYNKESVEPPKKKAKKETKEGKDKEKHSDKKDTKDKGKKENKEKDKDKEKDKKAKENKDKDKDKDKKKNSILNPTQNAAPAGVPPPPDLMPYVYEALAADSVSAQLAQKTNILKQELKQNDKKSNKCLRVAAGTVWEDETLNDWPDNDYRVFCGDLGNEVNDNTLAKSFCKYPSFAKAKVIRDKRTQKTKGFGFVSFLDPFDCARALKEMNGKYIGNRPVKLRKSVWNQRNLKPEKGGKKHLF